MILKYPRVAGNIMDVHQFKLPVVRIHDIENDVESPLPQLDYSTKTSLIESVVSSMDRLAALPIEFKENVVSGKLGVIQGYELRGKVKNNNQKGEHIGYSTYINDGNKRYASKNFKAGRIRAFIALELDYDSSAIATVGIDSTYNVPVIEAKKSEKGFYTTAQCRKVFEELCLYIKRLSDEFVEKGSVNLPWDYENHCPTTNAPSPIEVS